MATTAKEVIDSFESSFRDKAVIPEELELLWLRKAISRYSMEVDPIDYNPDTKEFEGYPLDGYTIDTIANFMKELYMEREVSKVNKRVSIVSKELSVDTVGSSKVAAKNELDYVASKSELMISNQLPTAYV